MASGTVTNRKGYIGSTGTSLINIVSWSTDYTERTFTATDDKWLIGLVSVKDASGGTVESNGVLVSVDGTKIANISGVDVTIGSFCVPVKKGQTISFYPKTGNWTAKVYYADIV